MSMLRFKMLPDGAEPFEVAAGTRDIYVWEKTSKGKTFAALMENMAMVDLYHIAHIAAQRLGLYRGTLNDFVTTCDLETLEDEDEDAGPFSQAQSAETSSLSPSSPASPRASGPKKATKSSRQRST
jgi:hypothetical protein